MLEPNRNYVIEDDGSIHKMLFCGDADWEDRATTSIQEIRNKAIDEFVSRLEKHEQENWVDHHEYGITWSDIKQIAEQMKGVQE